VSRIRIDLGIARQIVSEIQSSAEEARGLAHEALGATQSAPSYDGQFGPVVSAIGAELHARYTRLAQMLDLDAQDLHAIVEAFERADQDIRLDFDRLRGVLTQFLERYGRMLEAWSSVSTLSAYGMAGNGRWNAILGAGPPPGIPDEVWRYLPLEEKIGLWREAHGENGRQRPETEALPAPSHPTPDAGAGPFDSMEPTLADFAFEQVLFAGAAQWDLMQDRPDAARHMRHYLEGSGETLVVDVDTMLRDMPKFQRISQAALDDFIQDIEVRVARQYDGNSLEFQATSPWHGDFYATQADNANWFFAMGGLSYSYSAEVSVVPPVTAEADPTVEVTYQMHVWDYYNWDQGKSVTIPRPTMPVTGEPMSFPIPEEYQGHIEEVGDSWRVQDTALARLHLGGLAQEYEIIGQTEVSGLSYTLDTQSMQFEPAQPSQAEPPPER